MSRTKQPQTKPEPLTPPVPEDDEPATFQGGVPADLAALDPDREGDEEPSTLSQPVPPHLAEPNEIETDAGVSTIAGQLPQSLRAAEADLEADGPATIARPSASSKDARDDRPGPVARASTSQRVAKSRADIPAARAPKKAEPENRSQVRDDATITTPASPAPSAPSARKVTGAAIFEKRDDAGTFAGPAPSAAAAPAGAAGPHDATVMGPAPVAPGPKRTGSAIRKVAEEQTNPAAPPPARKGTSSAIRAARPGQSDDTNPAAASPAAKRRSSTSARLARAEPADASDPRSPAPDDHTDPVGERSKGALAQGTDAGQGEDLEEQGVGSRTLSRMKAMVDSSTRSQRFFALGAGGILALGVLIVALSSSARPKPAATDLMRCYPYGFRGAKGPAGMFAPPADQVTYAFQRWVSCEKHGEDECVLYEYSSGSFKGTMVLRKNGEDWMRVSDEGMPFYVK